VKTTFDAPLAPTHILLFARTAGLFLVTALAEILGCYLFYVWLRKTGSLWFLSASLVSLVVFAWLLTLQPTAAGRTYAAYGGVYVASAIMWLWLVDGQRPDRWDLLGGSICLVGMAIIVLGPRG
jgi:small multidrug resistance family-3 protein